MPVYRYCLLTLVCPLLLFWGCGSGENHQKEVVASGTIELTDGWARPGAKGMMSAVYLTIRNKTAYPDTLAGVSSDVAREAEVHESYKGENGMSAMRPAPDRVIKSGDNLYLQPGGLHIMLIKLKDDLAAGDSVNVLMEFRHSGARNVRLPVQAQR
ncbi:hypothetical protein SAMN05443144_102164 [Fodinibius roseus]|uniref:Copper(I)-binding protein n=1 Tax=Fodinibius roseus TaxID=1194090 RepID=A0A1M4UZU6_9BACT|nr:copper chaperone PCu(A)C [Fodinibius roseus]SHE62246.1 hypothetical protein SAMN05443144_102164 [Fodinibius roseus]